MATQKFLWMIQYASIDEAIQQAQDVGVTTLVVRTDNVSVPVIASAHAAGLQVFGWRWPSAVPSSAMNEAASVSALFDAGLDGYVVDPEGAPGKPYDWDQPGLDGLADQFCTQIKTAAGARPLGVTSHFLAAAVFPNLPWSTFVGHADILLPQAYWRSSEGTIGHGDPVENYNRAMATWGKLTQDPSLIVPMAGELASVTAAEIAAYGALATQMGNPCHFYVYQEGLPSSIWDAVQNI